MRMGQLRLVLSLGFAVGLSACGSVLQTPPDGGRDGGPACHDLNEAACRLRSDCAVNGCAWCTGGGSSFINCYDPASEPPVQCGPCPPPCSSFTDEYACKQMP